MTAGLTLISSIDPEHPGTAAVPRESWLDSAARYRALVDNSRDITTVLGPDATFIYQSPAISEVLGYSEDELLGRFGFDYVHPEDSAWALPQFFELLGQPGGVLLRDLRFRHKDGSYIELEMVAYNLLHDPAVGGIVVNSRDISARRRAEREILYQKTLLERMNAASNAGILVVDPQLQYSSWNERFLELWGVDDALVRRGREALLPVILSRIADPLAFSAQNDALNADSVSSSHDTLGLADGRVLERYSTPITGPGGENYGRVWFFHDVTELVRAREAAEEASRRISELAALRDRLTNMVVHDLRNPLSAISLMLQLLGDPPDVAVLDAESWNAMRRQIDYAAELCQQLLEIKRMEAGELVAQPSRASLRATLDGAVETLRPLAQQRGIELRSQIVDLELVTDHALLRRTVLNLLHNAIKYSPDSAVVSLEARVADGQCNIRVRDQGPGIPPERHDSIFELFAMAGGEYQQAGTGIGLAFCALAVKALAGSISVDSAPGAGSCFVVELPSFK
jgi:PAS domain S-box-containing protein